MAASPDGNQPVFGPLDAAGAVTELIWGLGHGLAGLLLILIVTRLDSPSTPTGRDSIALLGLAADLAWANASLVITIPQADFDHLPEVAGAIREAERQDPSPQPFRIHRLAAWVPIGWSTTSSPSACASLLTGRLTRFNPALACSTTSATS